MFSSRPNVVFLSSLIFFFLSWAGGPDVMFLSRPDVCFDALGGGLGLMVCFIIGVFSIHAACAFSCFCT